RSKMNKKSDDVVMTTLDHLLKEASESETRGDFQGVIEAYEGSLASSLMDLKGQAMVHLRLAQLYLRESKEQSSEHFRQAADAYRELGESMLAIRLYLRASTGVGARAVDIRNKKLSLEAALEVINKIGDAPSSVVKEEAVKVHKKLAALYSR